MSLIYEYNSRKNKFATEFDESGELLNEMTFKYYDCPCGGKKYKIVSNTTRHNNHFDIVQCRDCGTLRMNPYMSDESIERYYKEVYGPKKRGEVKDTPASVYERQKKTSEVLYKLIAKYINNDSDILDYGSSSGGRLDYLRESKIGNLHLFDFDENFLSYGLAKGFNRHAEGNKYDFMVLSHVIEHINHPVEFLKKIKADTLKKDGKIYIEVPFMESKASLLGHFHLAHKFYFTRHSLTYIAELAGYKKIADTRKGIIVQVSDESVVNAELLKKSKSLSNRHLIRVRLNAFRKRLIRI